MTVVPVAFQLASWIPAWWRADAGGDDVVGLMGPVDLTDLLSLRDGAVALTAYCRNSGRSSAGSEARDRSRSPVRAGRHRSSRIVEPLVIGLATGRAVGGGER